MGHYRTSKLHTSNPTNFRHIEKNRVKDYKKEQKVSTNMTTFNQGRAIADYAHFMSLVQVGAYDERDENGNYGADGIEESIDNLEELAAVHELEFCWHTDVSIWTLEPISAETRAAREAASMSYFPSNEASQEWWKNPPEEYS